MIEQVVGVKSLLQKLNKIAREAADSSRKDVAVGYTANYALYVHENLEANHPNGGQAKYLEEPMRTLAPELRRIIRETYQRSGNMQKAMLAAGLRLQRESQKLVPVDTGNLKASAYTRLVDK